MRSRAIAGFLLLAALASAWAFYWQFRDIPCFGNLQDDAVYVQTAKAIVTGQGYRLVHLPGQPFLVKYPPVYPYLLAGVWRIAGQWRHVGLPEILGALVAVNLLALAIVALGCVRLYRMFQLGPVAATALAAVVISIPAYVYLTGSVMTEIPFMAVFMWTLIALEHSEDTGRWKWAGLAGILAAVSYLTRTAAAPLLLAAPACFLLRRQWRHAIAFLAAAAPGIAAWQLWAALHKAPAHDWLLRFYVAYGDMERFTVGLDNVATVAWINLDSILGNIGDMFVFGARTSGFLGLQAARLIAIASIAGVIRLTVRTRRRHYAAFGLVFTALMVFWHYPPDQRLFLPLAPLLVLGLWTECRHLMEVATRTLRAGRVADRVVAAGFLVVLFALGMAVIGATAWARFVALPQIGLTARRDSTALHQAFEEVRRRTPVSATVLSDQDVLLSLYSGRTSYRTIVSPRLFYPVRMDRVRDAFAGLPDAAGTPWDYVLVTGSDWRHTLGEEDRDALRRAIRARPDLEPLWSEGDSTLYARRLRAAAGR